MAIAFDAVTTGYENTAVTSKTISHTITASGSDHYLVAVCTWRNLANITGITWNGVALTKKVENSGGNFQTMGAEIWYLVAPDTGTHDLVVTWASTGGAVHIAAVSFTGVDQAEPEASASVGDHGGSPSLTIDTVADDSMIIDGVDNNFVNSGFTAGANQTERWDININADSGSHAGSTEQATTPGTYTMSWTYGSGGQDGAHAAVSLAPASGGIPVNVSVPPQSLTIALIGPKIVIFKTLSPLTMQLVQPAPTPLNTKPATALSMSLVMPTPKVILTKDIAAQSLAFIQPAPSVGIEQTNVTIMLSPFILSLSLPTPNKVVNKQVEALSMQMSVQAPIPALNILPNAQTLSLNQPAISQQVKINTSAFTLAAMLGGVTPNVIKSAPAMSLSLALQDFLVQLSAGGDITFSMPAFEMSLTLCQANASASSRQFRIFAKHNQEKLFSRHQQEKNIAKGGLIE